MNVDIKSLIMPVVFLLLALCGWYYHGQYKQASADLNLAKSTITDMQTRQRDVAALDAKYTKELADAQETIDQLQSDVDSGSKRLRIKAVCVPKATSAASMDDGGDARLEDSAERDYFTLLKRIEKVKAIVEGQREYIKTQCLR